MSFANRSLLRASRSCSRQVCRNNSTAAPAEASSSTPSLPPLRASLLLSRSPLLTRTQTPLESAYYAHSLAVRHAISNPTPEYFYFREGSLPARRYKQASYEYDLEMYGPQLAGPAPEVGEIPPERPVEEIPRDHWANEDAARGEKSLERLPEEEIFCLVQEGGKWTFPSVQVAATEPSIPKILKRELTSPEGALDGKTMDTWLVTKQPIAMHKTESETNFFYKSHILAGEPKLKSGSPYKSWAWLSKEEIETRLKEQGEKVKWYAIRNMFGVGQSEEEQLWHEDLQRQQAESSEQQEPAA